MSDDASVGACTIALSDRPVEAALDAAAAAGADGVEVWGKDHVGDRSPDRCREIREAATERGLDVPVYGSYLRAGTDGVREAAERELRVAADLGADTVRVWAGDREYDDCGEAYWERVVADLGVLTDRAAERGLALTVERHGGSVTDDAAGAARLVETVEGPVGLNYQPLFRNDADAIAAEVERLAPLSNNVHLQAMPERGGEERCALADAYFDVAGLVETFESAGFGGYYEVEFVTPRAPAAAALAGDVAFLRALTR
jgi:sugar phosphate isomerase/epimerase